MATRICCPLHHTPAPAIRTSFLEANRWLPSSRSLAPPADKSNCEVNTERRQAVQAPDIPEISYRLLTCLFTKKSVILRGEPRRITESSVERTGYGCSGLAFFSNAEPRSATATSRVVSGVRPQRCSMVAKIDVVSCGVWSTVAFLGRSGEITMAGIRVPGPQASATPPARSLGGATWSHDPPNSS